MKDTFGNGPVADKVKDQHAKTSSEFRNLADSRTVPKQSTATGQNLTRKLYKSDSETRAKKLNRLPLVLLQSPERAYPLHSTECSFLRFLKPDLGPISIQLHSTCQSQVLADALLVGKSPCDDSFLHLDRTFHLRCSLLARLALVIQGSVYGTRRFVPSICIPHGIADVTIVTAAAEIAGKIVLSQGLASSFRPKKYYTIPREALEASLEDVEQLINFFVIEFQRMLFAENVTHTVAGFVAAVASYWLIKFVPFWGLSLIGASCIYLGPLIYMTNKELIDHHLKNASDIANAQANQVRSLAGHHTARAQETVRAYAGDYSAKAQEYIGSARGRSTSPEVNSSTPAKSEPGPGPNDTARAQETVKAYAGDYSAKAQEYVDSARGYSTSPEVNRSTPVKFEPGSGPNYSPNDFPHAPKQEPTPGVTSHQEQYENSQFGGQAEPTT